MHMHVAESVVRTTVEISDEVRGRLLAIAARRGIKGFSGLVQVAVESYLADLESENERVRRAVLLKGAFQEKDATNMRSVIRSLRGSK
jgi:metal-responsive CopG/Arc/MetJ family transcriptional regulator